MSSKISMSFFLHSKRNQRFLMKTFQDQDFSPYNGLQWEPNGSRSKTVSVQTANCWKGFKRFQTMNKCLIKRKNCSFKKQQQSLSFISSNGCLALFCDARSWLSCLNFFIKMNKSFFVSFGSFNERIEQIDYGKDLFILMNEFE